MIKGINKQILEVTNPESPYFEKIIFFVRPQGQSAGEEKLKSEALKLSREMRKPPKTKKSAKQILQGLGLLALGLGAGISIVLILNILL